MEQTVKLNLDTRQFNRGIDRATAALGAIASIATVRSLARLADTFQNINARLKVATGGGEAFARAQQRITQITAQTRGSLEQTTDLYARLARSTRDSAITADELATATVAINQAIKVSGASAQEANAAIIQLGQGLASGALRGDELRSVLEQTPRLARAIANGLGVTIGQLRELGTEGKLTTAVVLEALQREAPKIAEEFKQIPPTIEDAFTALNNTILVTTKTLNQAGFGAVLSGIAAGSSSVIEEIGKAFEAILPKKDLLELQKSIELAFLDTTASILKGVKALKPIVDPIFEVVKIGINNLISFFNALPPGVQQLGIIGFFLIGRSAKLILIAVSALLKDIARIFDAFFTGLLEAQNLTIQVINKIRGLAGKEALPLIKFDPNLLENGLKQLGFANGLLDEQGIILKQIGNQEKKNNGIIEESIKNIESRARVLRMGVPDFVKGASGQTTTSTDKGPIDTSGLSDKELKKQAEKLKKKFEQLEQSLMSESELEKFNFDKRLAILNDFYNAKQISDAKHKNLTEKLEVAHQKKMDAISSANVSKQVDLLKSGQMAKIDLTQLSTEEIVKFTKQGGEEVLRLAAGQNKKAFEAYKAFQLANALISTASAIANVLGNPLIPFPLNIAAAGVIGAAGAFQIAAIASQQYQGRQTGGLVQSGTPYMVGEQGPELFMPNQTGTVIPNGNIGGGGKPVTVNFNINTVNAQGMDEILTSRRGTITNIIREATQQNGQRSMV